MMNILTTNEMRQIYDLPPLSDGDELVVKKQSSISLARFYIPPEAIWRINWLLYKRGYKKQMSVDRRAKPNTRLVGLKIYAARVDMHGVIVVDIGYERFDEYEN